MAIWIFLLKKNQQTLLTKERPSGGGELAEKYRKQELD